MRWRGRVLSEGVASRLRRLREPTRSPRCSIGGHLRRGDPHRIRLLARDLGEEPREDWPEAPQFAPVQGGERCEGRSTALGERELHLAPVGTRDRPRHEALLHQPVDETDRTVVLDEELPGEIADRNRPLLCPAAHHEHRLILLRAEADVRGRALAEAEERPQSAAPRRQLRVMLRGEVVAQFRLPELHRASARVKLYTAGNGVISSHDISSGDILLPRRRSCVIRRQRPGATSDRWPTFRPADARSAITVAWSWLFSPNLSLRYQARPTMIVPGRHSLNASSRCARVAQTAAS